MRRNEWITLTLCVLEIGMHSESRAQYMYLDTNGDGIHTSADGILPPGTPTTIAVYLDTTHDKNGSLQSCNSHTGAPATPNAPLDLTGYSIILHAVTGAVSWGTWIDDLGYSALGTDLSNGSDLCIARTGATKSPGLWKLGHIQIGTMPTVELMRIDTGTVLDVNAQTLFGTTCEGSESPNAYVLGLDWFDTGAAGALQSWTTNGIRVADDHYGLQDHPTIASDGVGGSILAWIDYRSNDGYVDIWAQRVNESGHVVWNAAGVATTQFSFNQEFPRAASDGAGGALIVWTDDRSQTWDVYAQRLTSSGGKGAGWPTNGLAIASGPGHQSNPRILQNGSTGVFVSWSIDSFTTQLERLQAIDLNGVSLWGQYGVPLDSQGAHGIAIASDGAGGVIAVWARGSELRAQRLNGLGIAQWVANGVVLTSSGTGQRVVSDGQNGAVVSWKDTGSHVYAQRLDGSGALQWGSTGVRVCNVPAKQTAHEMTPDGAAGAILTWKDWRSNAPGVYARRISSAGTPLWDSTATALCSPCIDTLGTAPLLATEDGLNGAIISWIDERALGTTGYDIFAQRIGGDGSVKWTSGGVGACTAGGNQLNAALINDGVGGAYLAWDDRRQTDSIFIYEMRVSPGGSTYITGVSPAPKRPAGSLSQNRPNPFNPRTSIRIDLAQTGHARIGIYDVSGRLVRLIADEHMIAGRHDFPWDGTDRFGRPVASGVYVYRLEATGIVESKRMVLLK